MQPLLQDPRYGARTLLKAPNFILIAAWPHDGSRQLLYFGRGHRFVAASQLLTSIPGRPLVRALSAALAAGGSLLGRELGREVIANHAKRDDRREAVLRRIVCHPQAGLIHRLQ